MWCHLRMHAKGKVLLRGNNKVQEELGQHQGMETAAHVKLNTARAQMIPGKSATSFSPT